MELADGLRPGAKAVVFVGSPSDLVRHADHHWNLPANLPRFYVTDRTADA